MLDPLYGLPPGRRVYVQARALKRAKRRMQMRSVTATKAAVLEFPTNKKEVPDAAHQNDQA